MKLLNPFSQRVRLLYLGVWTCWLCELNGNNRGGLELHHILGRISGSAFNSALLCGYCHQHMGHTRAEHQRLAFRTAKFLHSSFYKATDEDLVFLEENKFELFSPDMLEWLRRI